MAIPNRASDAGPDSPTRCPACDKKWNMLSWCEACEETCCDSCAHVLADSSLLCHECAVKIARGLAEPEDGDVDQDAAVALSLLAQAGCTPAQAIAYLIEDRRAD